MFRNLHRQTYGVSRSTQTDFLSYFADVIATPSSGQKRKAADQGTVRIQPPKPPPPVDVAALKARVAQLIPPTPPPAPRRRERDQSGQTCE